MGLNLFTLVQLLTSTVCTFQRNSSSLLTASGKKIWSVRDEDSFLKSQTLLKINRENRTDPLFLMFLQRNFSNCGSFFLLSQIIKKSCATELNLIKNFNIEHAWACVIYRWEIFYKRLRCSINYWVYVYF